jgi:alginate O-acetyltransferase complex protein AlgI
MHFINWAYFVFLGISVVAYWSVIPPKFRVLFLAFISILFLGSYSLKYAFLFLLMGLMVFLGGRFIAQAKSAREKRPVFLSLLIALIAGLCFYKYFDSFTYNSVWKVSGASGYIIPFGLSYITFRLVHFLVESYRGNISQPSLIIFISYILFFPIILAGPVERFPGFNAQAKGKNTFDPADINYGLFRIALGIVKKAIIADGLNGFISPVLSSPQAYPPLTVLLSVYVLAIQIYMDFSGYTDMAIGSARLFGYRIMENFNLPFLRTNIAQFWRSWHISVYSWIRDYFFLPLFGFRASKLKLYMGIFLSMVVFHIWHRFSLNFLILGAYHGLVLMFWQAFQEIKRRYPSVRGLVERRYFKACGAFLTFNVVSFGFVVFFTSSVSDTWKVISHIF